MPDETTGAVEKAAPPKQRSYFNTNKVNRVMLDDGLSYIEHKLIDEGVYQAFQDLTSTVKLDGATQHTEVDLALGKSRKFLLENLVTGWNLVDEANNSIPFNYKKLMDLPPQLIAKVMEDIYTKNPVLGSSLESDEGKET
jgi:hypothetical protein